MTTISREASSELVALPESSPETLETLETGYSNSTSAEVRALSLRLDRLWPNDMLSMSVLLHDRSIYRRTNKVDYEAARAAWENAPIKPWTEQSPFADSIRCSVACRVLMERGWHESQFIDAMQMLAYEVSSNPSLARQTVRCGIRDGAAYLEAQSEHG